MHNYVVIFDFPNPIKPAPGPRCRDSRKEAIDYISSFKYSTKLFDNAYQVFTMQDLPRFETAITQRLNPDDSMIVIEAQDFAGQNIPNI